MSRGAARVIVGLSGGVDSAVAALLLRDAGHEVHGLYMANWEEEDEYCTAARDYQDARSVARELGIVLHRVSFAAQYRERVFAAFLDEYRAGRTPNPDVLCNREIKFGLCLAYTARLGATHFATGHYARLQHTADGIALLKATDAAKDQSYFLHAVPRSQLQRVLFPLGELDKQQVRQRAREAGLPVFDKPDSTGICFIGERPFAEFLRRYIPDSPGPIETLAGRPLGQHRGLHYYTLGQRTGMELGGMAGTAAEPWYVAAKDMARNVLRVVQKHDEDRLNCRQLSALAVNWLCPPPPQSFVAAVKVRYRQPDQQAELQPLDDGVEVRFVTPQRAVATGQSAVFYAGERCLGGGVIANTL